MLLQKPRGGDAYDSLTGAELPLPRSISERTGSARDDLRERRMHRTLARRRIDGSSARFVLARLLLHRPQRRVAAVPLEQLAVRAAFDDAAVVEDDDRVGIDDGRQPVRDDQGRAF